MEAFTDTGVHRIDIFLIVAYLTGITLFGIYYSRRVKNSTDYFLAGRSLPWWIIGMSIIGTNIGSNDYVGAAGNAYSIGIAQANFEWIGAIPAMIISALIFIPFYWRAGVFSIPEYLGRRYNDAVRVISAVILSIFSVVIVGVFLWATAIMLQIYLGWPVWFSIMVTACVVGFYTISGGLGAVAITDSIQMVLMFGGALALAVIGINQIGGFEQFITVLQTDFPDHVRVFLPSDHSTFPWPGVILGLGFVLSPAYWCANQAVLQRTMAARTEWDGRASMMFAAVAKSFVPLLIVLPGFFALIMVNGGLEHQDQALPWVIKSILPPGLSGIMFVVLIAALQSSIDSTMNATSVMVTRDIVGVLSKKGTDEQRDLKLGKIFTFCVLILGIVFAPLTARFEGIYVYIQFVLSLFQGPIFALLILGILYRKGTATAGLVSLIAGLCFAGMLSFYGLNMLYIAFWSFIFSVTVIITVSSFTEKKADSDLVNLTYADTVKNNKGDK